MSTPTPMTDEARRIDNGDTHPLLDEMEMMERELVAERAIVSRIWVQLGSPTYEQLKGRSIYDLIDEIRAELAIEREKSERYRLASLKLDAELATERARMDWLDHNSIPWMWMSPEKIDELGPIVVTWKSNNTLRAAIDAAMKEGA